MLPSCDPEIPLLGNYKETLARCTRRHIKKALASSVYKFLHNQQESVLINSGILNQWNVLWTVKKKNQLQL